MRLTRIIEFNAHNLIAARRIAIPLAVHGHEGIVLIRFSKL